MRKAEMTKRKLNSKRNRHNGYINADKRHIMLKGEKFQTSDGQVYHAIVNQNPTKGTTTRIVRGIEIV